jgi:hypothetical protein
MLTLEQLERRPLADSRLLEAEKKKCVEFRFFQQKLFRPIFFGLVFERETTQILFSSTIFVFCSTKEGQRETLESAALV